MGGEDIAEISEPKSLEQQKPPEATYNSGEQMLSTEQQEQQRKINKAKIALEIVLQPSPGSLLLKSEYDAWLARVKTLAQEYQGLTGVTLDDKLGQLRAGEQAQLWQKQIDAYTEMGKNGVLSTPAIATGFSTATQGRGHWQQEKERLDAQEQFKIDSAVKGVVVTPVSNM